MGVERGELNPAPGYIACHVLGQRWLLRVSGCSPAMGALLENWDGGGVCREAKLGAYRAARTYRAGLGLVLVLFG